MIHNFLVKSTGMVIPIDPDISEVAKVTYDRLVANKESYDLMAESVTQLPEPPPQKKTRNHKNRTELNEHNILGA